MQIQQIEKQNTDFQIDSIIEAVVSFFPLPFTVEGRKIVTTKKEYSTLFKVYDPIENTLYDARIKETDIERKDYIELLEIASWAVYSVLFGIIDASENTKSFKVNVHDLDRQQIKKLFLENLDNEEGVQLLKRISPYN